jgi:hypothetical protein
MERISARPPCEVAAHGSPGGLLQFGHLKATLAAQFHCTAPAKPSSRQPCSIVDQPWLGWIQALRLPDTALRKRHDEKV